MIPLVDIHCHLLAGMDDGPKTLEDALGMCAMARAEGVGMMSATAHQNERWPAVTPERIRQATTELRQALTAAGNTMSVFPCAEVMAAPGTAAAWRAGTLLSVGDRGQYVLLEMPRGVFVDLRPTVRALRQAGVRVILAHPERERDFLHVPGLIEELVGDGCLVQVSSASVTEPRPRGRQGPARLVPARAGSPDWLGWTLAAAAAAAATGGLPADRRVGRGRSRRPCVQYARHGGPARSAAAGARAGTADAALVVAAGVA